jgi:hypothetical protein
MPNQHTRVKHLAKGEEVTKDYKDQTYGFVDEFIEE